MILFNPITLILSGYLLAALLMLIFVGTSRSETENLPSRWLLFLLAAASGLALLTAGLLILDINGGTAFSQNILIILPSLSCLLVILLTKWRAFYALRWTHQPALIGLGAALLLQASLLGIGDSSALLALLAACCLAAVIWIIGMRAGDIPLIITGLLASAWLPLSTTHSVVAGIQSASQPILRNIFSAANLLAALLVILVPALLIYMQLQGRPTTEKWIIQLRLVMAFLFVSAGLLNAANQSLQITPDVTRIENYYPFLQFYAAVLAGSLLMGHLDGHLRLVGPIYAIGIIFASAAAFSLGWRITASTFIHLEV